MFCVTIASSRPWRSRSTRARCPAFGRADQVGEFRRFCQARAPDVRVADVGVDRGEPFCRRVTRPHPVRSPEIGDARVGRDARPREHDDAARARDQAMGLLLRIGHGPSFAPHRGVPATLDQWSPDRSAPSARGTSPSCGRPPSSPTSARGCRPWPSGSMSPTPTHNPLWTGLVAAAAFLPMGLLSPVGGALADRLDRRRWLIVTTSAEMLMATVLTVLAATGARPPVAVVVVAFLGGCGRRHRLPLLPGDAARPGAGRRTFWPRCRSRRPSSTWAGSSARRWPGWPCSPSAATAFAFACNAASFAAVVVALLLVQIPAPRPVTERAAHLRADRRGRPPCRGRARLPERPSSSSAWWPCWPRRSSPSSRPWPSTRSTSAAGTERSAPPSW